MPAPHSRAEAHSKRSLNDDGCISFIADTHFEAVRQIQSEIGLDALVVNTRQIPATGLGRLWKKPKVELLVKPKASPAQTSDETTHISPLPESPVLTTKKNSPLLNVYDEPSPSLERPHPITAPSSERTSPSPISSAYTPSKEQDFPSSQQSSAEQRCESILRRIGLDKLLIARICDEAAVHFKHRPSPKNRELLDFCRARFGQMWKSPKTSYLSEDKPIVFLGAPGAGKTTLIGKWVSLLSLKTDLTPKIWKLDGLRANTDEFLDLIADLHHVPIQRVPTPSLQQSPKDLLFIDIPGVDWNDPSQLTVLKRELNQLPTATHYLVLNAAYDNDILKRQIRAYAMFPIDGLILTHLDEEKRWTKILNITIGTNFPLRIVSGGQNIPGYFQAVGSEEILSHIFPSEQQISLE